MKHRLLVLCAVGACLTAAFAGPVDDMRAGTDVHIHFSNMDLVLSGALNQTIPLGDVGDVLMPKAPGSLDIGLDLAALIGVPGLPVVTMTGTDLGNDQVQWTLGSVLINVCLPASQTGLPFDLLVKRLTGAQLTAQTSSIPPFFDSFANQVYNVQFEDMGGNSVNFIDVETYAFCVESPFTRIDIRATNMDFHGFAGVPEPASLLVLGSGLVGLALRRRRK